LRLKSRGIVNIYPVLGDARNLPGLPFRPGPFNLITCFGALSEIVDKKRVIEEIYDVLSYGGKIVIMTFNGERIPLLRSWAYNVKKLKEDLEDCGLKNVRISEVKPFYIIARAEKHDQCAL